MAVEILAPAKVNLCLHIGPVREDGLHGLSSLVVFPKISDVITVSPASKLSLDIEGPFAAQLSDIDIETNSVIKAARLLIAQSGGSERGARILLTKNLPVASGIGGGTADAAAALVALRELWQVLISDDALMELGFSIGADTPVCLAAHLRSVNSVIMTGAGETIADGPELPAYAMCLINPGVQVETGAVFRHFDEAYPNPAEADRPDFRDLASFMRTTRNDLEQFAIQLCPSIAEVLEYLNADRASIATRMSGSGATCFGLFDEFEQARRCALKAREKGWWAGAGSL